jgi:hypothetical protein
MMNKSDPKLKAVILEAVHNQLKSGDPPETRQTFNRLIGEGISGEDAKIYIGQAIAVEIYYVMKHGEPFNLGRYRKNLSRLPEEPSE